MTCPDFAKEEASKKIVLNSSRAENVIYLCAANVCCYYYKRNSSLNYFLNTLYIFVMIYGEVCNNPSSVVCSSPATCQARPGQARVLEIFDQGKRASRMQQSALNEKTFVLVLYE